MLSVTTNVVSITDSDGKTLERHSMRRWLKRHSLRRPFNEEPNWDVSDVVVGVDTDVQVKNDEASML